MAEDWLADVRKYVPDADEAAVAGIVRYCGIALRNRDSSLVSFSDPAETGRVREGFLKKKLALTNPDDQLDHAIATVGERMKSDPTKNRVTVYYLLAEHFGLLPLFGGGAAPADAATPGIRTVVSTPAGSGNGADGAGGSGGARSFADLSESRGQGGRGWWQWLLLALLVLAALFFLLRSCKPQDAAVAPFNSIDGNVSGAGDLGNASDVTANVGDATGNASVSAPAPAPTSAAVTAETRNGAPALNVYFATGKADVSQDFAAVSKTLTDYLAANPARSVAVSGFNDPTGNAPLNAELSKHRAQAVAAALKAVGVPDKAIELAKPSDSTIASGDNAAARRVEVTVK